MQKRNGCTQRPTAHQVFIYLIYIPNIIFTYLHTSILQENIIHIVLFTICNLISIIYCIRILLSIPTDTLVDIQLEHRSKGLHFDYDKYKLESYCDICEAYVQENTKHCKNCNRCCQDFDHHCKWVNNCVGGTNYNQFIIMITSTFFQFVYSLIIHIIIFTQYLNNHEQLNILNQQSQFHYPTKYDLSSKFIISIIYSIGDAIVLVLLLQLIIFHIYIKYKGITTYEYIISKSLKRIQPIPQDITIFQHPSMIQQESKVELNIIENQQQAQIEKIKKNGSQYTKSDKDKNEAQIHSENSPQQHRTDRKQTNEEQIIQAEKQFHSERKQDVNNQSYQSSDHKYISPIQFQIIE